MYSLPEIPPLQKVKSGRTYKYDPTDEQKVFIKTYAGKVTQKELADHLKVSERTMKSILKELHLTNNSRIDRERKEQQHKEHVAKVTAQKIIQAEAKGEDPVIFITGMQTGKDQNGTPLNNEHRLTIDELQMASKNPKANADLFARMQAAKVEQRRKEREEANKAKNKIYLRKQKEQRLANDIKKRYQDMGRWWDTLWHVAIHVARAKIRDDEAQAELDIEGATAEVVSATGIVTYQDSRAAKRADKTSLALERAISKFTTEVSKIERRCGEELDENPEADKIQTEIMKLLNA